jgi:hypothetical protein
MITRADVTDDNQVRAALRFVGCTAGEDPEMNPALSLTLSVPPWRLADTLGNARFVADSVWL